MQDAERDPGESAPEILNDRNSSTTLLRNARIILPERIADQACLLVKNERIHAILASPFSQAPDDHHVIDLSGLTLFPGFIDVHLHGAVGVDANDTDVAGLHKVSQFLASRGVTAWLPTLVPDSEENYRRSIEAFDQVLAEQSREPDPSSRVLGVHYEGPFVSDQQCGALRSQFFKTFSTGDELNSLPRLQTPGAVHLTTVAPEIEGGIELIKQLTRRGWIISIGHTRASVAVLDQALSAGARHMTHFMNAMAPLHHRSPGPVAWGLMHNGVTCDIIADGKHLDPTILQLLVKLKGSAGLALISDSIAAAGLGDGDYSIWGESISVRNGRTSNAAGSIAGSVITMLDAVRMMGSLGVREVELAQMAATNPARLLGIDSECGSIEEGKRADLVAIDRAGEVRMTMIGGRVAFQN